MVKINKRRRLENRSFLFEVLAVFFSLACLFGVIGEPAASNPHWEHFFAIFVAVGVGGEFISASALLWLGRSSRKLQEAIDAENEKQAEIDRTTRVELESQLTATKAQIEENKAARQFSPEQREILKSAVSKFAGQKFKVFQVGFGDREAELFAWEIAGILRDAGWEGTTEIGIHGGEETMDIHSGVISIFNLNESMMGEVHEHLIEVNSALGRALDAIGVGSTHMASRKTSWHPSPAETIEIVVGPKPVRPFLPLRQ